MRLAAIGIGHDVSRFYGNATKIARIEHLGPALASDRIDLTELHGVLDAAPGVVDLLERDDRWWSAWDEWTPASATMAP